MKKHEYAIYLNDNFLGTLTAYNYEFRYSLHHGEFINVFYDSYGLILCILNKDITVKEI